MKKESRDRILQAYDEAFKTLNFSSFRQGINYICGELSKYLRLLSQSRTQRGLEAMLIREPEPRPEELDAAICAIQLLPYQLRKALPGATKEAAKQLPRPPGGRPRLLIPEECRQACRQIGALLGDGVELGDAQKRVAQQERISLRTMQRVWQKRKKPSPLLDNL